MNRLWALSRTTHGVLDIAAPGFVALLWLGAFPAWERILLSLATAFAAYTAIYALNDLVSVEDDREKVREGLNAGYSVEASALRHPLAQGALSLRGGWLWFAAWYGLALLGAWLLNPSIVILLLAAAALEVLYCRLLKVTYWRILVSGLVKASGPLSAILVVDSSPAWSGLLLILSWVMLWEVGGQNIPADWNDIAEDRRVGAKTLPLTLGTQSAGLLALTALTLTVMLSLFLPGVSPLALGWPYGLGAALIGLTLLLLPALRLYQNQHDPRAAAYLFDRASYYPLAQLSLITLFVLLKQVGWL